MARIRVEQLHFRVDCQCFDISVDSLTRSRDNRHGGADKEYCLLYIIFNEKLSLSDMLKRKVGSLKL